ncbi:MAG: phosphoribosylaminoimidazolesuccinocarboxamide synthase [Vicinamibacterales bacterium]
MATTLDETHFESFGQKYTGKVRDMYMPNDLERILVATDRQSAFDIRKWTTIPLKGQVLTQISTWWFDCGADVMPTHVIEVPDQNVMVVKRLRMVMLEIVVRGYLTGSTNTSAWVNYQSGSRHSCGNLLEESMVKNQRLGRPIVTPTTKGDDDELIDPEGIVAHGLASQAQWNEIERKALALFERGQEVAATRGLILVDTKYEMGYDQNGTLTIGDEVHTPDSSRYWIAATYEQRMAEGKDPDSLDKEFFRLWLRGQGFDPSRPDDTKPVITDDARLMLATKYIDLYERITGNTLEIPSAADVSQRIRRNLEKYRTTESTAS